MGSKGIIATVLSVRGQGKADTVLNKKHCDCEQRLWVFFKICLLLFFLILDSWNAKGSSVPSHRNESPGFPLGHQLPH